MHLEQNTGEWLEFRRHKLGASDAPVVMGISPWKTPYMLWEEKLGLIKDQPTNYAMKRGNDLEETARHKFEEMMGMIMEPAVVIHPDFDFMIASLDGMDSMSRNIVEIKCPGLEDHQKALSGHVPDKYIPQLQHQLAVTGLPMAYYFSFDGQTGKVLEVLRDDTYIDRLIEKEIAFWSCVTNMEAPERSERDYVEKGDDVWRAASDSWLKCHRELESLKAREEELRETLICLSGKSNARGAGITLTRVLRKGSVDYKRIPELDGVDLDKYRKSATECWRISANG